MENQRELHPAPSVCIVYKEKVFVLHHRKLDKWLFPGGHVDQNEANHEAAFREGMEETGFALYPVESQISLRDLSENPLDVKRAIPLPFHANVHSEGAHDTE